MKVAFQTVGLVTALVGAVAGSCTPAGPGAGGPGGGPGGCKPYVRKEWWAIPPQTLMTLDRN